MADGLHPVAGVGIDLERVERFAGEPPGPSPAFVKRVFGDAERAAWNGSPGAAALCFTAKEAIAKALGGGLRLERGPGVPCRDIEVLVDLGARSVAVRLRREAAERAAVLGARNGWIWCWYDATAACTVAVLLGDARSAPGAGTPESASYGAGLAIDTAPVPPSSPSLTRASADCDSLPYCSSTAL